MDEYAVIHSDNGPEFIAQNVRDWTSEARLVVNDQGYVVPKKNIFNRVIGGSHLELVFANFVELCADVVS